MKSKLLAPASLALAFSLAVGAAQATPIDGSATGLASPTQTIDFSEVALAPAANNWASFGVTFSPGLFFGAAGFGGSSFGTPAIYNFFPCCTEVFSIFFNNVVNGAVFNAVNNSSTQTTFEALLGGSVVASFVNAVPITNTPTTNTLFWGFDSVAFDQIRINHPQPNFAGFGFDNLSFRTKVPEPSTVILLGIGLIGLFGAGYARRREDEVI